MNMWSVLVLQDGAPFIIINLDTDGFTPSINGILDQYAKDYAITRSGLTGQFIQHITMDHVEGETIPVFERIYRKLPNALIDQLIDREYTFDMWQALEKHGLAEILHSGLMKLTNKGQDFKSFAQKRRADWLESQKKKVAH